MQKTRAVATIAVAADMMFLYAVSDSGDFQHQASMAPIARFLIIDCTGLRSTRSPMQWHDSLSPSRALHARNMVNPASVSAVRTRVVRKYRPEARAVPRRNSAMTMSLAANEQRSNPARPKENIYNSKPSIEKSFETAERMKHPPISNLMTFFKA